MDKRKRFLIVLAFLLFCLLVSCGESAPELTLVPQIGAVGVAESFPSPEDFFEELPLGATVSFLPDTKLNALGENRVTLILRTQGGREYLYHSTFTLVFDVEPPVISGTSDLSAGIGEGIAYRSGVSVSDTVDPNPTLTVDSSKVNLQKEGSYPVTYTATDFAGNSSSVTVTLRIYKDIITKEMLFGLLEQKLSPVIGKNMTVEEKVRVVYDFVYRSISYENRSDKSDWVRAAYYGLTTGYGDCFTYFSASKACFEYLGIENMDLQRTTGLVPERHYWNLVNLGNNRWYHFDACHLVDKKAPWGCLMTDAQLETYSKTRVYDATGTSNYFYAFDSSAYPARAMQIITEVD